MPRPRSNQHLLQNTPQSQLAHQASTMYQQQRSTPEVQRSQGVIFLSSNNKPQQPAAQQQMPSLPTHSQLAHQVNQMPAHHSSMFQPQNVPPYIPTSLMQNPFFPYYHQIPAGIAQGTSTIALNDIYTPNGAGTYNDTSMQTPPEPIKPKPKGRSRYVEEDSDSSSDEYNDDEGDPDWNVARELQELVSEPSRSGTRGRRASTTPRGRGRGGGRGRGRGRGRGGRVSDSAGPPALTPQSNQYQNQSGGRQTRNTLSMPMLDPQTGQMSFGELVSQAVQSLNDPDDQYGHQKRRYGAIITALPNKVVEVARMPVDSPPSMYLPITYTAVASSKKVKDGSDLFQEEEDLIMTYEIVQDEDKQRPFMCETCGEETRSRVLHNQHLISHNPSCRFACCICSQLFENHEHLKPHLRTHHGSGIFVCPETDCEGVFSERKSLDDHDFACHPNARPFVCRFCLDRFSTDELAKAHEEAHDEDIEVTCMKCPEKFITKSDIKHHYSQMHEERTCQFCSEKFVNQLTLDNHLEEKHEEEMRPPREPTPPPSPAGPADDDLMHSPGGAGDDDDDIVVVEERKKTSATSKMSKKPSPSKAKQPIPGTSKSMQPIPGTSKSMQPIPGTSKSLMKPGTKPIAKPGLKTPLRPGPKSSKPVTPGPIKSKKPTSASDVITLSSDSEDEKDPGWKPPENLQRKSYPPPPKRPSRRKPEYLVTVETKADGAAGNGAKKSSRNSNQTLTFQMNEKGELEHIPGPGESHSKTLPIKEIMEIIKRKKLTDNTTIVIENNKITSTRPSGGSLKPIRPLVSTPSSIKRVESSSKFTKPSDHNGPRPGPSNASRKSESSSKPVTKLVAKKSTGGVSRSDRIDLDGKSDISSSSGGKARTGIAKKRTGGSSSLYDKMDSVEKPKSPEARKPKQSRKEKHSLRVDDSNSISDDEYVPLSKRLSSGRSNKSNRNGTSAQSRSPLRDEKNRRHFDDGPTDYGSPRDPLDYYDAPKRSLRIAVKASKIDAPGEDSLAQEDVVADETYEPVPKKRGRKSVEEKNAGLATAAANGQVVMKALVNGKWQDVVIGTKVNNEPEPLPSTSKTTKPPPKKPASSGRKPGPTSQKSKANNKKNQRKSGGGRKGKQKPAIDCWSDDRYQFSGGSRVVGSYQSEMYHTAVDIKEDSGADYGQGYGDDTMLQPFSLSSAFEAYQNMPDQMEDQEPDDQGFPVIMNAYHLPDPAVDPIGQTYENNYNDDGGLHENHDVGDTGEVDEIPLQDPLAMDDGPADTMDDYDPLADAPSEPPPPPVPVEIKKGTAQEAKSAINTLRSVLSQITFKR